MERKSQLKTLAKQLREKKSKFTTRTQSVDISSWKIWKTSLGLEPEFEKFGRQNKFAGPNCLRVGISDRESRVKREWKKAKVLEYGFKLRQFISSVYSRSRLNLATTERITQVKAK